MNSDDSQREERLSAYLDGELSPDERADVERWLAADPTARQLLDELRSLGSSLNAVPRGSLGEDFAESVLRRAQRERAASDGAPTRTAPLVERAPSPAGRLRSRRPWVYAAVALAAALVLMVTMPPEVGDEAGRLAQAPLPESPPVATSAESIDGDHARSRAERLDKGGADAQRPFFSKQGPAQEIAPAQAAAPAPLASADSDESKLEVKTKTGAASPSFTDQIVNQPTAGLTLGEQDGLAETLKNDLGFQPGVAQVLTSQVVAEPELAGRVAPDVLTFVVDVDATGTDHNFLESVLTDNGIQSTELSKPPLNRYTVRDEKLGDADVELVYLRCSDPQLQNTLVELGNSAHVRQVEPQTPRSASYYNQSNRRYNQQSGGGYGLGDAERGVATTAEAGAKEDSLRQSVLGKTVLEGATASSPQDYPQSQKKQEHAQGMAPLSQGQSQRTNNLSRAQRLELPADVGPEALGRIAGNQAAEPNAMALPAAKAGPGSVTSNGAMSTPHTTQGDAASSLAPHAAESFGMSVGSQVLQPSGGLVSLGDSYQQVLFVIRRVNTLSKSGGAGAIPHTPSTGSSTMPAKPADALPPAKKARTGEPDSPQPKS